MGTTRMRRFAMLGFLGILPLGGSDARAGLFDRWFNRTTYVEVVPTVYTAPIGIVTPTAYYATSYGMPGNYAYVSPTTFVETVATIPTVSLGTSYLPRSYVASSYYASAYVPTVYDPFVSTSYVVPTSYTYQPTSYAYYAPTSYQAPLGVVQTYYEAPLVAMAATPACETKSGTPQPYQPQQEEPTPTPTAKVKPVPPVVGSTTAAEEKKPITPKPEAITPERRETGTSPVAGGLAEPGSIPDPLTATPPPVPSPTKEAGIIDPATPAVPTGTAKPPAAGGSTGTPGSSTPPPPVAPAAPSDDNFSRVKITPENEVRRENYRPTMTSTRRYVRSTVSGDLNLLEGRVKSAQDGSPLGGIPIRASNRKDSRKVKDLTSDASGRYSVNLSDGEWSLSVADQNGVMRWVRDLIVTNGQIVDDRGRDVPALTITW